MFPALPRRARLTAALVALVAGVTLGGRVAISAAAMQGDIAAALWDLARYFTILTNLLVVVTFLLLATRRNAAPAPWIAALTLSILLVGGVYHLLLAHLLDLRGLERIVDHGLHTAVPVACALWWLVYAPKRGLVYSDLPIFALWPTVYIAYALWRGSRDNGVYPYPFMDLSDLSAAAVAANLGGLLIVLLLGGVAMITIGRYADR